MGRWFSRASTAAQPLKPEDLIGRPSIWRRAGLLALIAVVAWPVLPTGFVVAWTALFGVLAFAEQWALAWRDRTGGEKLNLAVFFSFILITAFMEALLIARGDGATRLFAVALISLSSVSILLRVFNSPRLFLAALAPHFLVMAIICWSIARQSLGAGAELKAL